MPKSIVCRTTIPAVVGITTWALCFASGFEVDRGGRCVLVRAGLALEPFRCIVRRAPGTDTGLLEGHEDVVRFPPVAQAALTLDLWLSTLRQSYGRRDSDRNPILVNNVDDIRHFHLRTRVRD